MRCENADGVFQPQGDYCASFFDLTNKTNSTWINRTKEKQQHANHNSMILSHVRRGRCALRFRSGRTELYLGKTFSLQCADVYNPWRRQFIIAKHLTPSSYLILSENYTIYLKTRRWCDGSDWIVTTREFLRFNLIVILLISGLPWRMFGVRLRTYRRVPQGSRDITRWVGRRKIVEANQIK